MKPEFIHLLAKLKADHPDFQNLILNPDGVAMACLRHGYRRFESLDALEAYAWPSSDGSSRGDEALTPPPPLPPVSPPPPLETIGFHQTPPL